MAAVGALLLLPAVVPIRLPPRHRRPPTPLRAFSYSSPPPQETYRVPQPRRNLVADWVSNNDGLARSLPIYAGGISLLAVLANRAFSGVAPVADASSSQSRADLLTLALAVTNLLAGLVVILQPLGDRGIAIIGGDTIRGFSNLDQAWITLIAEKLDATLSKFSAK